MSYYSHTLCVQNLPCACPTFQVLPHEQLLKPWDPQWKRTHDVSVLWNLPKPSCKSMQCTPHRTIMNHIEINIEDHQTINFRKLPESSNFVATSKMLEMSTEDGRFSNTWRGACSKSFLSNLYFTLRVWRILVGGLGSCWDLADISDIEWDFECITEWDLLSMGNSMADDGHSQIFLLCKLWKGWGVGNNLIILRILLKMKIGESIYRCINLWSTWSFLKLRGIIIIS
jgi:hypothetical protein